MCKTEFFKYMKLVRQETVLLRPRHNNGLNKKHMHSSLKARKRMAKSLLTDLGLSFWKNRFVDELM